MVMKKSLLKHFTKKEKKVVVPVILLITALILGTAFFFYSGSKEKTAPVPETYNAFKERARAYEDSVYQQVESGTYTLKDEDRATLAGLGYDASEKGQCSEARKYLFMSPSQGEVGEDFSKYLALLLCYRQTDDRTGYDAAAQQAKEELMAKYPENAGAYLDDLAGVYAYDYVPPESSGENEVR
jgi:hypothetical protein